MNYMEQVAEMLGVKLGEKFRVKNSDKVFKLTKDGCLGYLPEYAPPGYISSEYFLLTQLLSGGREIEKPILDRKEKEYLENVLRPFKDRVDYILKYINALGNERIVIQLKNNAISLPEFKKGTMYKGMENEKEYSLKELGLFEDE